MACVHSPKCGSGNRPIDKYSAINILQKIKDGPQNKHLERIEINCPEKESSDLQIIKNKSKINYGVFDIETQKSAQEVGGWHKAYKMKISCVVLYDSREDKYYEYLEKDVLEMMEHLKSLDLVIGFNIKQFDYSVISGYIDYDFSKLKTLDLLEEVHKRLGYRLSLDRLAQITLNAQKTADGLMALKWWKEGKLRKIIDYCTMDVKITKDLYVYGRDNGYLLFKNKAEQIVRVPAKW